MTLFITLKVINRYLPRQQLATHYRSRWRFRNHEKHAIFTKTLALKSQLKKVLTGLDLPQEYICLDLAKFQSPLSLFLSFRGNPLSVNVTDTHLFLGYKPLIIGLMVNRGDIAYDQLVGDPEVLASFEEGIFISAMQWHGFHVSRSSIARLVLKKVRSQDLDDATLFIYEGIFGAHQFINRFHRFIHDQRQRWQRRNPNNVSLPGNLYQQVSIAYALPRVISLITVCDGGRMNMFPTDLHGRANGTHYIGSLRIGGKACQQVEQYKRIVLSNVDASCYKTVYDLGKNHMKQFEPEQTFSVREDRSAFFGFPLPQGMNEYYELQWKGSSDHGIHRIHYYAIVNYFAGERYSTLAHIHRFYGQWRKDNGYSTEMLIR
jgi:hypothetical protein